MRPVERGPATKVYENYRDARDDLIARVGDYCSYCEMALPGPAVEHVQPKSVHPGLETAWDNFLLGCPSCNSVKGATNVAITDCYWPDADNTSRAFVYELDGPPRIDPSVPDPARARRTLALTGLDRMPGHPDYSDRDRRWLKRREVWGVALLQHRNLQRGDTAELRDAIAMVAIGRGFFSVWMAVFQADPDMRRRLIHAFPGTARSCFDPDGRCVPRPGGAI